MSGFLSKVSRQRWVWWLRLVWRHLAMETGREEGPPESILHRDSDGILEGKRRNRGQGTASCRQPFVKGLKNKDSG
jgi:hypothetical protein